MNESLSSALHLKSPALLLSSFLKHNKCTKIEPGIQAGDNEMHIFSCWLTHYISNIVSSQGEVNHCSVAQKGDWSDIWEGNVTNRNKILIENICFLGFPDIRGVTLRRLIQESLECVCQVSRS